MPGANAVSRSRNSAHRKQPNQTLAHSIQFSAVHLARAHLDTSSLIAREAVAMLSFTVATALLVMQSGPVQQQGGPPPTQDAIAADTGMLRHATKKTPPIAFASRLGPGRE